MTLPEQIMTFLLVLFRCAGFLAFAPVIGGRQIPRMVKVGFSMSLAWLWLGEAMAGAGPAPDAVRRLAQGIEGVGVNTLYLFIAVARETALGAATGYLLGLFLVPARIAGIYLGHESGLQMATVLDPNSNTSGNVLSEVFDVLATMLFFAFNAHHLLLAGLHSMFQAWPVGGALPDISANSVADRVSAMHQTGLLAALPAATLLFVIMCGLLALMRSAPQFSLFSVGQSLRVGAGLIATLVFLPHSLVVLIRTIGQLRTELGFY